jgi:transcriptional regulator with XRE-family HTH domain
VSEQQQSPSARARLLGTRLRALRRLSQQELATKAGWDVSYVGKLERGARGWDRASTIEELAAALAVTPTDITAPRNADARRRAAAVRNLPDLLRRYIPAMAVVNAGPQHQPRAEKEWTEEVHVQRTKVWELAKAGRFADVGQLLIRVAPTAEEITRYHRGKESPFSEQDLGLGISGIKLALVSTADWCQRVATFLVDVGELTLAHTAMARAREAASAGQFTGLMAKGSLRIADAYLRAGDAERALDEAHPIAEQLCEDVRHSQTPLDVVLLYARLALVAARAANRANPERVAAKVTSGDPEMSAVEWVNGRALLAGDLLADRWHGPRTPVDVTQERVSAWGGVDEEKRRGTVTWWEFMGHTLATVVETGVSANDLTQVEVMYRDARGRMRMPVRICVEVARAYRQHGQLDAIVRVLGEGEQLSREELYDDWLAAELLADVIARERRPPKALCALAVRCGAI